MKRIVALSLVLLAAVAWATQATAATQMKLVAEVLATGNELFGEQNMSLALGRWKVTVLSSENDSESNFLFCEAAGCDTKWSRGDVVTLGAKTTWFANGNDGRFNETSGKYYTFTAKDVAGGTNSEGFVFETDNAPVTIASVTQSPGASANCVFNEDVTVTVTLSGAKSTQEKVYVRYTTDDFANTTVVEISSFDGSHKGTATIPGQSVGAVVKYYPNFAQNSGETKSLPEP